MEKALEYTIEFYGWANSVIITVGSDEIEDHMGMVDCDIVVKSGGETIYSTTLTNIRESMHPKTYRNHTKLYNEYSQNHSEYKVTYEEYKGFGGSYTITSENSFDIKNLHFKFLTFNPFINDVTVLEDLEYTDGEIGFNNDFDFDGKSLEETIHQFRKPTKKLQSDMDDSSEIGQFNKLYQLIDEEIENQIGSESSIIEFAKSIGVNPFDKENNFIGLLKLKSRVSNIKNVKMRKMGLFKK